MVCKNKLQVSGLLLTALVATGSFAGFAAAAENAASQACVTTPRGPHIVRGTEIRLSVREEHFAGRGLHLFAEVLSRFFDLWAHTNSFTQLRLVSAHSGEVLVACPRREGSVPLL